MRAARATREQTCKISRSDTVRSALATATDVRSGSLRSTVNCRRSSSSTRFACSLSAAALASDGTDASILLRSKTKPCMSTPAVRLACGECKRPDCAVTCGCHRIQWNGSSSLVLSLPTACQPLCVSHSEGRKREGEMYLRKVSWQCLGESTCASRTSLAMPPQGLR